MRKLTLLSCVLFFLGVGTVSAQYTDIMDLSYATGGYPWGSLVQSGAKLYGMNSNGGANGEGCVFSINTNGSGYTDLLDFNGSNGANPYGSLIISGGAMYCMTSDGGANGEGNVFSMHLDGSGYKDLLDFNGTNGAYPEGSLILYNSNVLYGMTEDGGAHHVGSVFSIDTDGTAYTDVMDFNTTNGANPTGSLIVSGSTLYGMTAYGGAHGDGCIFSIQTNGSGYTDLTDFSGANGANPQGDLMINSGTLYGMTSRGGTHHYGRIFSINANGSGYTDLMDFNGANGAVPYGSLTLSPTGLLYGMTEDGGASGYGSIFSIKTNGSGYVDVYDFNYTTGGNPYGSILFSSGVLYGMTTYGGANDNGVIFNNNTCTLGLSIGSVVNNQCYGNNGSATANATGGVTPYTYLWSNGTTTALNSGLSGGSYTVTVSDLNSCIQIASVTITSPAAALSVSASTTANVSCGGGNNGNATASVNGGTSPYTYSWSNGSTNVVSISNPTGAILTAGTYTVTVTDLNGCTMTSSATITQPNPIRDSIASITYVGCNGGNAGGAVIGVKGGKFPYTYQWAPNTNSTKQASSLSAGTYTVTVTDNAGCSNTIGVSITQPTAIRDSLASITYPLCNGGRGNASIGVTGGTPPYTYTWTGGVSTTATANNISSRTYTVTIKDNHSCTSTVVFTLTQPNAIRDTIVQATKVNVTCNGGNNGSATLGVLYGTPPYTYSWSNGQTTATATGLSAGVYSVTVVDNAGCSGTLTTVTIFQSTTIHDSVASQINVRCNGGNSGFAGIGLRGGTSPYTFLWAPNGKTAQSVSNLSAGSYSITVTDNNGCSNTVVATITQPGVLLTTAVANSNVSCNGGNNGSVTANNSGGTAPFTYSWSNGNTTGTITGLTIGTYTVTVHDNCGASSTSSVTITQPGALAASAIVNSEAGCNGGNNGSATATPNGGTSPYTYLWSDPSSQTSAIASGLTAGTYTITITDANNCTATASVAITQPFSSLAATAAVNNNVTCNGGSNGSATATPSGGTAPYTYTWSDASSQNTATATGLSAGSYTITIADATGCSATAGVFIVQPNALSVSTGINSNVNCNGGNNGSAAATASFGTAPYNYSWSDANSQTTATANGLVAGTYTVTVTDSCGGSSTASVTISQPGVLTVGANTTNNVTCNGGNDGSITATPGGGTSPYTYLWSDASSQTNATASGLAAGTYTVNVTDANGCSATASSTISQPVALSVSANANSNVGCNGGNNGTATATANNGNAPYTYSWSDGSSQTTATATGLSAGTYTVTVHDNCNASSTASVTLTQPANLSASATASTEVRCHGGSTGVGTANVSGGTSPYTYLWSDAASQTTISATGLSAGTYTVNVTDGNNCTATASVTITQPGSLTGSASVVNNISCNGSNNGSAKANVSNGTAPYTYAWSTGGTFSNVSNLSAGTYTVTIHDNCGASSTGSVTITQPNILSASASVNSNVICNGGNSGNATANVSGGTIPYTYTWSDASSQTNATATGLSAGSYSVNVKDAHGCTTSASVTITQPGALSLSTNTNINVNCNGGNNGSATANASNGTLPYTYTWSDASSQTTATATGLSAGIYTVTAQDNCGTLLTATITITQPASISVSINTGSNVTCNGGNNGNATAIVGGGISPYTYLWSDASSQTTASATGLSAGTYTVTVTDANSCSNSASVLITQPNVLTTNANIVANVGCNGGNTGSASSSTSGGTLPYTYSWSNGNTTANVNGLSAGSYTLTVFDNCGASSSASVTITQPNILTLSTIVNSNVTCNSGNNGSATATAGGGTTPYNYLWSDANSQTAATATGLVAGTYTVTVTDGNECSTTAIATITQPIALSVTIPTYTNVTCNNLKNGTANAVATGGNVPYTYAWSNGLTGTSAYASTSANATGMSGTHTYTVTVHDLCGASATASVIISNPAVISSTFTKTQASACGNVLGTATSLPTGGTPPYISYLWSNGQTTATASNLIQATYTVTITDNNGCTGNVPVSITKAAPIAITFTSVVNVGCNGGNGASAQALVTGGNSPYTFSWSNWQTSQSASGLSAGTYTLTLYDNYNCSNTAAITITQPGVLSASLSSNTNVSCNGGTGSASIGVSGGTTPYTYSWTRGLSTTSSATGLIAGSYTVSVRDNHNCSSVVIFTVTQPAALRDSISSSSCVSSQITATVGSKGGTTPYSYAWSPSGGTQATMTGLAAGSYTITITDAHHCTQTIMPSLTCAPAELPRGMDRGREVGLYPNPSTGLFSVSGLDKGMTVEVYDYMGKVVSVFVATDETMQVNLSAQPNGIYLIRVLDQNKTLGGQLKVMKTQ